MDCENDRAHEENLRLWRKSSDHLISAQTVRFCAFREREIPAALVRWEKEKNRRNPASG